MLALAQAARALSRAPRPLGALATASRRFAAAVDSPKELLDPATWAKTFDEEGARIDIAKLREMESELVASIKPASAAIDWDHWRSEIKYPGLVDEVKAEFEAIPDPDVDAEIAKAEKDVEDLFNPIINECDALAKESETETAELQQRLVDMKYLNGNLEEVSMAEYLEKNPDLQASIEDDIANDRWFVEQHS